MDNSLISVQGCTYVSIVVVFLGEDSLKVSGKLVPCKCSTLKLTLGCSGDGVITSCDQQYWRSSRRAEEWSESSITRGSFVTPASVVFRCDGEIKIQPDIFFSKSLPLDKSRVWSCLAVTFSSRCEVTVQLRESLWDDKIPVDLQWIREGLSSVRLSILVFFARGVNQYEILSSSILSCVTVCAYTLPHTCDPLMLNCASETPSLLLPPRCTDSGYIHHCLSYINLIEREKNKRQRHIRLSWGSQAACWVSGRVRLLACQPVFIIYSF